MEKTKVLKNNLEQNRSRIILMFAGFMILMFGFALTVNADVLTRQLELGMSGADVSSLQTFLAKDRTIYPQGLVTGYFGSLTKSAVSNFQARNGISSVGRVGPITMVALNNQMNSDNAAPFISNINVGVSGSTATLNWNTNENSTASVYYSPSPLPMAEGSATSGVSIGGSNYLANSDMRSYHSATLGSLSPNTTYYYVLYVRDAQGNESVTWPSTFRTTN